jgi:guanine nucleotide-binding protein subunit alpha
MRLIHKKPFTPAEIETYRQLVFVNMTHGFTYLLEAMEDNDLKVSESNMQYLPLFENICDLHDGEPYPNSYYEALKSLWADNNVQEAWRRGNEAALPDKFVYFILH